MVVCEYPDEAGRSCCSGQLMLYRFRRLVAPPLQPCGASRPVRGTRRAELSGFGKAGNVMRNSAQNLSAT